MRDRRRHQPLGALVERLSVVVLTGPIASGKSTLARALAARLGGAAVIDLDLVYEMLADPGVRKDNDAIWTRARHVTAQLVDVFLADDVETVVVDGDVRVPGLRVALRTSYASAVTRVDADSTRTFSRDLAFLSEHYAQFVHEGDLVLDTDALTVDEAVDAIVSRISS